MPRPSSGGYPTRDRSFRRFAMTRYAFISRLGSVAYVAVTYDENGGNLPSEIDGNKIEWNRIEASHGEVSHSSLLPIWSATYTKQVSTSRKRGRNRAPSSVLLLVRNTNLAAAGGGSPFASDDGCDRCHWSKRHEQDRHV